MYDPDKENKNENDDKENKNKSDNENEVDKNINENENKNIEEKEKIIVDIDRNEEKSDNDYYATGRNKGKKFFSNLALVCIASLIGGSTIGFGIGVGSSLVNNFLKNNSKRLFSFSSSSSATQSEIDNKQVDTSNNNLEANQESNYSTIEEVSKSVVAINTSVDVVDHFFGFPVKQNGSGSGIIFHSDDDKVYIVTNAHVISGASNVGVSIENSSAIEASLVGKNTDSDIAVISLKKSDLDSMGINNFSIAKFGDSSSIYATEKIYAIGNALGEGNTVTSGIISNKNKKIDVDGHELSVIQIDASVNFGNSGGALVNRDGEVIGITTAKYARFAVEGMAYCIPVNDVKPMIEKLMNEPSQLYLGVNGFALTEEISKNYGVPQIGYMINNVIDNTPAKKAGLQALDIITMIDNQTIYGQSTISDILSQHKPNDKITLHILREGKHLDIDLLLEENNNMGF